MTRSAPSFLTRSSLAGCAVTMSRVFGTSALQSWIPAVFTPPPPPWMTAVLPSFRPPTRKRFRNAVMYDSQTQAASSKLSAAGIRMRWLAYATAYSA